MGSLAGSLLGSGKCSSVSVNGKTVNFLTAFLAFLPEWDFANHLISVPIITLSVLVLTKIKRWATMADSTRLQSVRKGDIHDRFAQSK